MRSTDVSCTLVMNVRFKGAVMDGWIKGCFVVGCMYLFTALILFLVLVFVV